MMAARPDALWALSVGGVAFAVYLRTLAPGLVAVVDTPMFQFIGRVLGVAHNPGYPLYVLLTFPFSYLPIGSLPYRINLFSAILAAVTVSLTFLIARRLGCRRLVSAAASLGMAFGHVFWSQAIIAEVYTLHSALIAGVLLSLLAWTQTGRPGFFYAAMALFAAGLGNHTTIVGFAPGIAIYALLTDRQFALRARTLAITALIVFAGLLQYGFIIIRSRQPGTYVESRATTIGELVGVMRGRQFSDRLFAFDWRTVFTERLPWLVERILTPELTLPGLVLAVVGAGWLLRRRLPEGVLLLLGGLIVAAFAVNYSVVDTPVFLIPTTLVLWTTAAVGAEQSVRMADRRRMAAMAVASATLILPAWQLTRNFAMTDRSEDTSAAVTFDGLFNAVPDRSEFVHEDFLVDRMVMFKLLGEGAAGTRHLAMAPRNVNAIKKRLNDGFHVFGFQRSVRRLRFDGLNFSFAPMAIWDGPLSDVLSRLRDGSVVALASPAAHVERFSVAPGIAFAAIGGPATFRSDHRQSFVVVGVRGSTAGALVKTASQDLHFRIGAGEQIGESGVTLPSPIEIWSGSNDAAIRQGGRDLVRSFEGPVLAVWSPDGGLKQAVVLQASDGFRVPIPSNSLSVYPLLGMWGGTELSADGWTDIMNATATGTTMLKLPAGSSAIIYLAGLSPLAPRVTDRSVARLTEEITSFHGGNGDALAARLEADGLKNSTLAKALHVYRIAVGASRGESASVITALGGVPTMAVGRIVRGTRGATAFRVDTTGLLRTPDRSSEVLLMTRDEQSQLIGDGWSSVDWDQVSAYRWMTRTEARFLLPVAKPGGQQIRIQALLEEGGAPRSVGLHVNEVELPQQTLRSGWQTYEWTLPARQTETPVNEVVIRIDRLSPSKGETPARGIAVTEIRVVQGR
jgi:Protein O-mannosyl-transferase TMEM260-like